jgi:transcription initiation factor TFIIIB Brf1 subunit/transcription initiation factor TFIIB
MNRFIRANSDGQSQCYNCGTVGWDIFMFKDAKFDNERVCTNCKKLIEQGKPETEIKWKGFIPKYRIENKLDFDKEVE